jgi:hypothetical protein
MLSINKKYIYASQRIESEQHPEYQKYDNTLGLRELSGMLY